MLTMKACRGCGKPVGLHSMSVIYCVSCMEKGNHKAQRQCRKCSKIFESVLNITICMDCNEAEITERSNPAKIRPRGCCPECHRVLSASWCKCGWEVKSDGLRKEMVAE